MKCIAPSDHNLLLTQYYHWGSCTFVASKGRRNRWGMIEASYYKEDGPDCENCEKGNALKRVHVFAVGGPTHAQDVPQILLGHQ